MMRGPGSRRDAARVVAVLLLGLLTAGCSSLIQPAVVDILAKAELRDASGRVVGEAQLTQVSGGVRIVLDVHGLPAGVRGVHVHEHGTCEGPAFASAGSHFNPERRAHGLLNPQGPHAGDLPNITIAPDATGRLETFTQRLTLEPGPHTILGRALLVDTSPDDFRTEPDGGSGTPIACGVIVRSETGPAPVRRPH